MLADGGMEEVKRSKNARRNKGCNVLVCTWGAAHGVQGDEAEWELSGSHVKCSFEPTSSDITASHL
jgi:hypothetical protein